MARSKKKGSRDDRKKRKVKMSKGQKKRFLTEILAEVAPPKRRIRNTSIEMNLSRLSHAIDQQDGKV